MERKPVTQQKLEIQSLIDQLGSALESYYDDSEVEVEDLGRIFGEDEDDAVGMIRQGYAKLESGWINGHQIIDMSLEPLDSEDEDYDDGYNESTQYDNVINQSNNFI
jgi:hypothetical protein